MTYDNGTIEVVDITYRVFGADSRGVSFDEMTEVSSMAEAMSVANEYSEKYGYVYIEGETKYDFTK